MHSTVAGLRVLVAEDEEVNQILIRAALEALGHSCEIAGDGARAVEAARRGDFDLVLMDIQMPVVDGLTAARRIRKLPPTINSNAAIPIVSFTSNSMPAERRAYLEAGMDDHISKPLDSNELARVIGRVMSRRHAPAPAALQQAGEPAADA